MGGWGVNLVWRFVGAGCETSRLVVKTKKSPLLRLSCLILSLLSAYLRVRIEANVFRVSQTLKPLE